MTGQAQAVQALACRRLVRAWLHMKLGGLRVGRQSVLHAGDLLASHKTRQTAQAVACVLPVQSAVHVVRVVGATCLGMLTGLCWPCKPVTPASGSNPRNTAASHRFGTLPLRFSCIIS